MPVARLSRKIFFNASRTLWRRDWSKEKNLATYGEETPHGYGHNYALEVEVEGAVDAEKGMVVNLSDLDRLLREEVDRPLDHRNLNLEVSEFSAVPPTFENLAAWIWRRVTARLAREGWPCRLTRLVLRPSPDVAVEIDR